MTKLEGLIQPMPDIALISIFLSLKQSKAEGFISQDINDLAREYKNILNSNESVSSFHHEIEFAIYKEMASRFIDVYQRICSFDKIVSQARIKTKENKQ